MFKKFSSVLLAIVSLVILSGCRPYGASPIEEIGPSDTAFLVDLDKSDVSADAPQKFGSIGYFEANKVASKRVEIPVRWRETGYPTFGFIPQGEWIPAKKLIKVNRAPIVSEWTEASTTGTSNANQAISVESSDSIGFFLGVVVNTSIVEEDAATYLYWYGEKQLVDVTNSEVRNYIVGRMSDIFGAIPLNDARTRKQEVFKQVQADTQAFFKEKGITVSYVGLSEGLTYENPAIQTQIDKSFLAEQDKINAIAEQQAQVVRNQTAIATAKSDAEKKQIEAEAEGKRMVTAAEAEAKAIQLKNDAMKGNSDYVRMLAIQRWDGKLPASYGTGNDTNSEWYQILKFGPQQSVTP